MITRKKKYEDYGFSSKEEAYHLVEFCRRPGFPYKSQLMICAEQANGTIAGDIFETIVKKTSYAELNDKRRIPICEKDFYAYRRKTLGNMRQWLVNMGVEY